MGNKETGVNGEALAAEYLEARGYIILERNYRFQRAEVDLVCFEPAESPKDGGELVFVEVKTRTTAAFGNPETAVDREKQKNLIRAARSYLYEHKMERAMSRFDVVAVRLGPGHSSEEHPDIVHIKAAFTT